MAELIVFGVFMIISFILGAYVGQKVVKGENIEINPIKVIDEYKEEKKAKEKIAEEESKFDIMNIDSYDGTGIGQKDLR